MTYHFEVLPKKEYDAIKRQLDEGTKFVLDLIINFLQQLNPNTIDKAIDKRVNLIHEINKSSAGRVFLKSAEKLLKKHSRNPSPILNLTYVMLFLRMEAPHAEETIRKHPLGKEWLEGNIEQIKKYLWKI